MEQERKQGPLSQSIDFINNLPSALGWGRRVGSLFRGGLGAGKVVESGLAATAKTSLLGTLGPAFLVLGIIFSFVFIFVFTGAGGGGGGVGGGQPDQSLGQAGASGSGGLVSTYFTPTDVFYCQWRGAWANEHYDDGTYAHTGCGPVAMAMILSSYGFTKTPDQVGEMFTQEGWAWQPGNTGCRGNGCLGTKIWDMNEGRKWLTSLGFETPGVFVAYNERALNLGLAKKFLDNNYLLYAGASNWPLRNGPAGHALVIEEVDVWNGTITVRDPNNCWKHPVTINSSLLRWYFVVPIRVKQ